MQAVAKKRLINVPQIAGLVMFFYWTIYRQIRKIWLHHKGKEFLSSSIIDKIKSSQKFITWRHLLWNHTLQQGVRRGTSARKGQLFHSISFKQIGQFLPSLSLKWICWVGRWYVQNELQRKSRNMSKKSKSLLLLSRSSAPIKALLDKKCMWLQNYYSGQWKRDVYAEHNLFAIAQFEVQGKKNLVWF